MPRPRKQISAYFVRELTERDHRVWRFERPFRKPHNRDLLREADAAAKQGATLRAFAREWFWRCRQRKPTPENVKAVEQQVRRLRLRRAHKKVS
jgi:hypothetical protein